MIALLVVQGVYWGADLGAGGEEVVADVDSAGEDLAG